MFRKVPHQLVRHFFSFNAASPSLRRCPGFLRPHEEGGGDPHRRADLDLLPQGVRVVKKHEVGLAIPDVSEVPGWQGPFVLFDDATPWAEGQDARGDGDPRHFFMWPRSGNRRQRWTGGIERKVPHQLVRHFRNINNNASCLRAASDLATLDVGLS